MITLILKGTDGCNLRCKYCSIGKKNVKYQTIDLATMKLAVDYVVNLGKERNETEFTIILHGGEPTLVDYTVYQDLFEYVLAAYSDKSFRFSMQTNCFHFSDDYIAFLKKYDVGVGVSIDGSEKIHNRIRVDINGKGSFSKVKDNILRLRENGICVSGLIVVTKDLLAEDLSYLNFFNYHNISLKLNPLLNYGEASQEASMWLEPGQYSDYLKRVYQYQLDNDIEIDISPLSDIFKAVVTDSAMRGCSYRNECGRNFLCIDFKGDIYPCGRFSDVAGGLLGNVHEPESITQFIQPELSLECKKCRYLKWCYGGCSAYRVIMNSDKSPFCNDIKALFDYFSGEGISAYIAYLQEQKAILKDKLDEIKHD